MLVLFVAGAFVAAPMLPVATAFADEHHHKKTHPTAVAKKAASKHAEAPSAGDADEKPAKGEHFYMEKPSDETQTQKTPEDSGCVKP